MLGRPHLVRVQVQAQAALVAFHAGRLVKPHVLDLNALCGICRLDGKKDWQCRRSSDKGKNKVG